MKPALSDVLPGVASATLLDRSYRDVFVGGLESGFGLGIDTSQHQYGWLTAKDGVLMLAYPPEQLWGAIFITVGKPYEPYQKQFDSYMSKWQRDASI